MAESAVMSVRFIVFSRADKGAGLVCRNDADVRFAKTRYQDILTAYRGIQETGVPAQ